VITEKTIQRGDLYAVYKCTESTHQEERFREEEERFREEEERFREEEERFREEEES
jgi:hypothetical protein